MRLQKVLKGPKSVALATTALAAALVPAHPASASPRTVLADRECTVPAGSDHCQITVPLWLNSNSLVQMASANAPATGVDVYAIPTADPGNYYRWGTWDDVNQWHNTWRAGNYVFELYCDIFCPGTTLYVTRY